MAEAFQRTPLLEFLRGAGGALGPDRVVGLVAPLVEQVRRIHEQGQVAPLEGLDQVFVSAEQAWFPDGAARPPRLRAARVEELQRPASAALEVVEHLSLVSDLTEYETEWTTRDAGGSGDPLERPVYIPGYRSWEHLLEHHDALTDVFVLGLVLASLALHLDFTRKEDVERFALARENLFALHPGLHPVLEKAIVQATELNRHRRLQDLAVLAHRLRTWREAPEDDRDLGRALAEAPRESRRRIILSRLRDRLFEISKRNRLLYFEPTASMVNLTEASVPVSLHLQSIKPEHLLTWSPALHDQVVRGKDIHLKKYLRFEDCPYVPAALDQARSQSVRDRKEFGFSQLRLAIVFFRWHNLKEDPRTRIHSPLLLLPVELEKQRGIRDSYLVRPLSTVAEVNPALRYHLKELYGLDLPATLDLEESGVEALHARLEAAIKASEPGIDLKKIDRPRIGLIHARAVQRLDRYRQRERLRGRGIRQYDEVDFSYASSNFQPLGLQIYTRRLRPVELPLRGVLAGRTPEPVEPVSMLPQLERERELYSLKRGADNPYTWEFDLCAVTLGNFNYRKMTLVRDFTNLIEGDLQTPCFDQLFTDEPMPLSEEARPAPRLSEAWHVVDCDPTQARAIADARERESLVIQGPPGTGKSQTITNQIADFCARGQRVLFVCAKRAAIDVVYHRLKQRGLHHLCCLIHDSQTDKKDFVSDLKARYAAYITRDPPVESWQRRDELVEEADRLVDALEAHGQALHAVEPTAGASAQQLIRRLVELGDARPDLDAADEEAMPSYAEWAGSGPVVRRIHEALRVMGHEGPLQAHPLAALHPDLLRGERPVREVSARLESATALLQRLRPLVDGLGLGAEMTGTLAGLAELGRVAARLQDLARHGSLPLLDRTSAPSAGVARLREALAEARSGLEEAEGRTTRWREKLSAEDTEAALERARQMEASALSWLKPAWWSLTGLLKQRYDLSGHAVKPTWTKVLGDLQAEHAARARAVAAEEALRRELRLEGDPTAWLADLDTLRDEVSRSAVARTFVAELQQDGRGLLDAVLAMAPVAADLAREAAGLLRRPDPSLADLAGRFDELGRRVGQVSDFVGLFADLGSLSEKLQEVLLTRAWTVETVEAALAAASLAELCRRDRSLLATSMPEIERRLRRLEVVHRELLALNSTVALSGIVNRFRRNVQTSAMPTSQLTSEQKEFKKVYAAGRRVLEHEFNKTMRYRAIRELAEGESGRVISDLKPVWLMSPLSVADTLPLDPGLFDVVIFDEASQIPIEEAIPAMFRARRMIVVGDQMQLPPTNFFSARADGDPLEGDEFTELDSDSFLSLAARQLPSTMLGWHYRSRSEALISFCNAAFYKRGLLTIPDRMRATAERPALEVDDPRSGGEAVASVLERPISFHLLRHGVYSARRNAAEATWLAHLVRGLLQADTGLSLGVVAFSEAQQGEIESALRALGDEDEAFRERLEAEYEREEEDQFCGLFVKNLENVQGDERDVILLSVCYGPDEAGRVRMNFGPINQNGGEKRLNVIFSRARKHVVVVSSLRPDQITNTYNDGANCFRRYLEFAQAVSRGQQAVAERLLDSLCPDAARSRDAGPDAVVRDLAWALEEIGYACDLGVGQSDFVCDLAVYRPGDDAYRLGVLVDTDRFYRDAGALERYLLRPEVMRRFGWEVALVKTADWYADRDEVLNGLVRRLTGAERHVPEPEVALADPYAGIEELAGRTDFAALIADSIQVTENVDLAPSIVNLREELVARLQDLAGWVDGEYRQAAWRNGALQVAELSEDELRTRISFMDVKGIGKTLNQAILEYRRTGTIQQWERLRKGR